MSSALQDLPLEEKLASGHSHFIDIPTMPWQASPFPGIVVKVLYNDPATGMSTMLVKLAPGATIPLHQHVGVEQTYILEGSLEDHEGTALAGHFCWREPGNTHIAHAPNGALVLAFFTKPNRFFGGAPHIADYVAGQR